MSQRNVCPTHVAIVVLVFRTFFNVLDRRPPNTAPGSVRRNSGIHIRHCVLPYVNSQTLEREMFLSHLRPSEYRRLVRLVGEKCVRSTAG